MATENIVTGKKFRILTDAVNKVWDRISYWTKASDVEFNDADTAQAKVGAIKGITTSTSVTQTGYAADASVVSNLNSSLTASDSDSTKFQFSYDSTSDQFGYIRKVAGADTFVPFNRGCVEEVLIIMARGNAYFQPLYYNGDDFIYYNSIYYTALDQNFFEQFDFCKSASVSYPQYSFTFEEGYYSFVGFDTYTPARPQLEVVHMNDGDTGKAYLSNWIAVIKYVDDPTQ